MKLNQLIYWVESAIIVVGKGICTIIEAIGKRIGNHIHRIFLIKILNGLYGYLQYLGHLF